MRRLEVNYKAVHNHNYILVMSVNYEPIRTAEAAFCQSYIDKSYYIYVSLL